MARLTRTTRIIALAGGVLAAAALIAAALPAAAQVRGALRGKRTLAPATPEATPLQVFSEVLTKLQLTEDQRQQIRGIISAHRDELLAVAAAEHSSRGALRAAIRQPSLDAAGVTAAAGAVARADIQLSLQRAAIFSEVWAVLTDAQRQQLKDLAADAKAKLLERLGNLGNAQNDPAAVIQQRANRLGLTDDQKAQIKAIFADHKSTLGAVIVSEVVARGTLNAAIHQQAVDETAVRRSCVPVAAADLQLDLERARIFSEVWGVLTPEQQEQLGDFLTTLEARVDARVEALLNIFKALF